MFEKVKDNAPTFLILLGLAIKFGLVAPGGSTPDFVKPAPKVTP